MTLNSRASLTAALVVGVVVAMLVPGRVRGQDIDLTARLSGIVLPQGYYDRIQRDPAFFELRSGWRNRLANVEAARAPAVTGQLPLVVIQALFSDSPQPTVTEQDIQAALFDGPSEHGTVSALYTEMSGGLFTVTGTALPWARTSLPMVQVVGTSFGLGADALTGQYIVETLDLVDVSFDFSAMDNDGPDNVPNSGDDDGVVDAVAFQFLEIAASCGGPAIWPHRSRVEGWVGSPYETDDMGQSGEPILVNDYIMQSAVNCNGTEVQPPTVIGHELGHVLGIPDFYDNTDGIQPTERRWVMGCWALMAGGAWGCGQVDRTEWNVPTHMAPYAKLMLGWVNETIVDPGLNELVTLGPVHTSRSVLRIPMTGTEYFLVENRQAMGFDRNLPASGVLVYHVDSERPRRPCSECEKIYMVSLEEADGNDALKKMAAEGGNRGEAGDVFGVAGKNEFTGATTPSTALNSGEPSGVTFYSITFDQNNVATIRLSTTVIAEDRLLEQFLDNAATPLDSAEKQHLDDVGNQNGGYDLGDFRRYILAHPSVTAPSPTS